VIASAACTPTAPPVPITTTLRPPGKGSLEKVTTTSASSPDLYLYCTPVEKALQTRRGLRPRWYGSNCPGPSSLYYRLYNYNRLGFKRLERSFLNAYILIPRYTKRSSPCQDLLHNLKIIVALISAACP
jgi:hypothetical protein